MLLQPEQNKYLLSALYMLILNKSSSPPLSSWETAEEYYMHFTNGKWDASWSETALIQYCIYCINFPSLCFSSDEKQINFS